MPEEDPILRKLWLWCQPAGQVEKLPLSSLRAFLGLGWPLCGFCQKVFKSTAATGLSSREQGTALGTSNRTRSLERERLGTRHGWEQRFFKASVCAWDLRKPCAGLEWDTYSEEAWEESGLSCHAGLQALCKQEVKRRQSCKQPTKCSRSALT